MYHFFLDIENVDNVLGLYGLLAEKIEYIIRWQFFSKRVRIDGEEQVTELTTCLGRY